MKSQVKLNNKKSQRTSPGSLVHSTKTEPKILGRLEGENKQIPNMIFTLDSEILDEANKALRILKLNFAYGPFELAENNLSISPVDVGTFISAIERTSDNEFALFRIRKMILEKLNSRLKRCKSDFKISTYRFLINELRNLQIGKNSDKKNPSPQFNVDISFIR